MARKKKPNNITIENDIAKIKIESPEYGLFYALIDVEDVEKIKNLRWHIERRSSNDFYVVESDNRIFLHRYLMDCPKGMVVDHINHQTLDNRKVNLRICTQTENLRNKEHRQIKEYGIRKRADSTYYISFTYKGYFAYEFNIENYDKALKIKKELIKEIDELINQK